MSFDEDGVASIMWEKFLIIISKEDGEISISWPPYGVNTKVVGKIPDLVKNDIILFDSTPGNPGSTTQRAAWADVQSLRDALLAKKLKGKL